MFNAARLTLARQRRGMTKTDLAVAIGMTPRTISSYENEKGEPSPKAVAALSSALRFPPSFFSAPSLEQVSPVGASFRSLSKMTAGQRDAALSAGALCIALEGWLSERFELPENQVPELDPSIVDPETAALTVRAQWDIGELPTGNMIHLLEAHGVRVFSLAEECKEVDAFSFWNSDVAFVCLNTMKTAEHGVFDAAHELGHLVLHRGHGTPRGRQEQQEANTFASSFLMPRSDVLAFAPRFPGLDEIIKAKSRWHVSAAALNYRLHKLGATSDWHYRELCIQLSRYGRSREPNPMSREQSQLLEKVFTALRSEGIKRGDVAAALHLNQSDLDALVFGLVMSSLDGGREGKTDQPGTHLQLV